VFDSISTFNTPISINNGKSNGYNIYYTKLADMKYIIYGLSSFVIPFNSSANYQTTLNSTFNSIDFFTINTNNLQSKQILFSADIFTVNVNNLCKITTPSFT
jgi:hypothetical protein